MTWVKCFRCGGVNSNESITCSGCGAALLGGQEYEEKLQELKDYEEFRKRYSILGSILAILVLLLLCPAVKWLVRITSPMLGTEFLPPAVILEYAAPAIILLVFLIAVLPMILGRWRIRRRYRWTRERMRALDREVKSLPKDFFATAIPGSGEAQAPVRKIQGPPTILLVIVFALVGLVYVSKYMDLRPLVSITSLFGTENAPTIGGQYDCHLEAEDYGGVRQAEQTWSYVFHSDGTYTTYLEGYQQYSGTWSQSGSTLTINVPAIPNISAAYSFQATVSRDGNSFTSGKRKWVRAES